MAIKHGLAYATVLAHFRHIRKILNVHKTLEILQVIDSTKCKGNFDNIILTSRGAAVFRLFLQSYTIKDIACRLEITQSAVRRHKEYMLFQNDCESMTELVSKYYGEHDTQKSSEFTDA